MSLKCNLQSILLDCAMDSVVIIKYRSVSSVGACSIPFGQFAFCVWATTQWNALPDDTENCSSISGFNMKLKIFAEKPLSLVITDSIICAIFLLLMPPEVLFEQIECYILHVLYCFYLFCQGTAGANCVCANSGTMVFLFLILYLVPQKESNIF